MTMKIKKIISTFAAVVIIAFCLVAISQPGKVSASALDSRGGPGSLVGYRDRAVTTAPVSGISLAILSDAEKDALSRAILEEYGALNLYQSVIDQYGTVYPFSRIVLAEQQHINALISQANKYGVEVPPNPGSTVPTAFNSLNDACQAGVDAEIADAGLYDQLMLMVTHSDILRVFTNLQSASLNSHLPVFQVCQ